MTMESSGSRQGSILSGESGFAIDDPEEISLEKYFPYHPRRGSGAENDRMSRHSKFHGEMWSGLDDCVLEKIIARLPFKAFYMAASLSKSWRLTLRSPQFQREARSSTASWKSYAPLFVNAKMDFVGYESSSKSWHRLPNHSFITQDVGTSWFLTSAHGSLFCWTSPTPVPDRFILPISVSNPLTKSWRQLPCRPGMNYADFEDVVWEGGDTYKVIVICINDYNPVFVQIFDSTSGSWTEDSYLVEEWTRSSTSWGGHAVINGVLFMLFAAITPTTKYRLVSLDLNEKIWKGVSNLCQAIDGDHRELDHFCDIRQSQVLVCGSKVMLLIYHGDKGTNRDFDYYDSVPEDGNIREVAVLELDLESGVAVEVSKAPNEMLSVTDRYRTAAQGDYIYFGGRHPCLSKSIVYNVGTREWDWVSPATYGLLPWKDSPVGQWRWTSHTYQPGLNPFLEV